MAVSLGGNTAKYLENRLGADVENFRDSRPLKDQSNSVNYARLLKNEGEEFEKTFAWLADDAVIDYALQVPSPRARRNCLRLTRNDSISGPRSSDAGQAPLKPQDVTDWGSVLP